MQIREISLRELLVSVLLKWRGMLIAFVIGATLFGAFSFVSGSDSGNPTEEIINDNKLDFSVAEKKVQRVIDYENLLAQKEEYYNTSILMTMDPNSFIRYECIFAVKGSDIEESIRFRGMYEGLLTAGAIEYCANNSEYSSAQLNEIISLNSQDWDENRSSFSIRIQTATEEQIDSLKALLINYYEDKSRELVHTIGEHELVLIGEQEAVIMDSNLQIFQINWKEDIFNCRENIRKSKEDFTVEEKMLYDSLISGNPIEEEKEQNLQEQESSEQQSYGHTFPLRNIVVGGILFFMTYVCVILFCILFNSKISLLDLSSEQYGFSVLGIIYKDRTNYLGASIDRIICRIRNIGERKITNEETLDLAISDIKRYLNHNNILEVTFAGCNIDSIGSSIYSKVAEALNKEGIITSIVNNLLYDVSSIDILEQSKAVVLIEKCGITKGKEIEREAALIKEINCNTVGMIIVE